MKIAITGPTGNIGRKLVKTLQGKEGVELILLARDARKLEEEQRFGATVIEGDLKDGVYLRRALEGVDTLFFLIPPDIAAKNVRAYYNHMTEHAACAVGSNKVSRVVLLSSLGAHLKEKTGPILGLHDAEWTFGQSDVDLFCLRPAYFMENLLAAVGSIQAGNAIYLPVSGSARTPMIATEDIAETAAAVLCDRSWTGKRVLELQGAADVSFDEAAKTISQVIGREVQHIQVTAEQAFEALTGMGLGEDYSKQLIELLESIDRGWLKPAQARSGENTTPTTFAEFARDILAPAIKG